LSAAYASGTAPAITLDTLQRALLWLMLASGFVVVIEPAPTDFLFIAALLVSVFGGLRITIAVAPLILFAVLYNFGGFLSFLEVIGESKAWFFVVTSIYMAAMAIFLAFAIPADPMGRMAAIRNGWILAALIASVMGLIGYFGYFGMGEKLTYFGRANGLFKDPNVFSTFLIAPAIFLIQGLLIGRQRWPLLSAGVLMVILAGLFLAFSRGAWFNFLLAAFMLVVLSFALAPSFAQRNRIVLLTIFGAFAGAALLAALLSIEQVRELFADRAALLKDYDTGATGRFGTQLASIPIMLERPWGFGPTYYRRIFGADPHNVYLNAFAAYGWLGGFAYPLLCISTLAAGWKAMMTKTPFQHHAIAAFCVMLSTMLQGVQIDTDHWRHFYLLVGLCWGLYAATMIWLKEQGPRQALPASQ
jgi:O-antigen ligase